MHDSYIAGDIYLSEHAVTLSDHVERMWDKEWGPFAPDPGQ